MIGAPTVRDEIAALIERARSCLRADPRAASLLLIRAARFARTAGEAELELRAHWGLMSALGAQRKLLSVLRTCERALALPGCTGDFAKARTLFCRGSALVHVGRVDDAESEATWCVEVFLTFGERALAARALGVLAAAHRARGRLETALDALRRGRTLLAPTDGTFDAAAADEAEGLLLADLGKPDEAVPLIDRATATFESLRLPDEAAVARTNLGFAFMRAGRLGEALQTFNTVLARVRDLGPDHLLPFLLVDRSLLLADLGAVEAARADVAEAASSTRLPASALDLRRVHLAAARVDRLAGRLASARSLLIRLAASARARADRATAAAALCELADVAGAAGLPDESRAAGKAAWLLRSSGWPGDLKAAALLALARSHAGSHPGRARAAVRLARCAARRAATPWTDADIARTSGLVERVRGRIAPGLDEAVADLAARRDLLPSAALGASFLAVRSNLHAEAVDALVRAGDRLGAVRTSLTAKSSGLRPAVRRAGTDPAEIAAADSARRAVGAAYTRLHESVRDGGDVAAAHRAAREAEARYMALAATSAGAPVETALGTEAEGLPEGVAFVDFAPHPERGFHAHVVAAGGATQVRIDVGPDRTAALRRRFEFALACSLSPYASADERDLLERALESVAAEFAAPLPLPATVRSVVVSPCADLAWVPFHVLLAGRPEAGTSRRVAYAAIGGRRASADSPALGRITVLGGGDVGRAAAAEAGRVIMAAASAQVRLVERASARHFLRSLGDSAVVHVAAHGVGGLDVPGPGLRFADGWITTSDLESAEGRAELVVLGACSSGAAHGEVGGGRAGIVQGLIDAGAAAVVAARWPVHEDQIATWTTAFYERLALGDPIAAAFAAAQSCVRRAAPGPSAWGALTLTCAPADA